MDNSSKQYKGFKHIGPGGMRCHCCVPFSPNKMKKYINRVFRRNKNIDSD